MSNRGKGYNEISKTFRREVREYQYECDHKTNKGPTFGPVSEARGFIENKNSYTDTDVICDDCKDIWNMSSITRQEFDDALNIFRSACNQIKVLGRFNPSDPSSNKDYQKLVGYLKLMDGLEGGLVPYYFDIIDHLCGKNNNNNNRNNKGGRSKGRLGVSAGSYNTR